MNSTIRTFKGIWNLDLLANQPRELMACIYSNFFSLRRYMSWDNSVVIRALCMNWAKDSLMFQSVVDMLSPRPPHLCQLFFKALTKGPLFHESICASTPKSVIISDILYNSYAFHFFADLVWQTQISSTAICLLIPGCLSWCLL